MRFKLLLLFILTALLLALLSATVMAQEPLREVPPPYAGLKNPFGWDDASAQESGKRLYGQSCLACHGARGNNLPNSDFSAADFTRRLEERPDFYLWILSEGRLDKGMPPFKSSLSESQRWQVLTYLYSLGREASSPATPPPPQPTPQDKISSFKLTVSPPAQSGRPLTLSASLRDNQGKPIGNATVKFFVRVNFFISGLMEIGDTLTNEQGVAILEYTPRQTGNIEIVARYESFETTATLNLGETTEPFYHPEVGLRLPAPGDEVFIGPKSALDLGEMGAAPMTAFRLPGGKLSWLLIAVVTLAVLWSTYFRVIYQVFRIPIVSEIGDTNTRLVPMLAFGIVVILGILLLLMLTTGPYSHLHLLHP